MADMNIAANADLPTRFGTFRISAFADAVDGKEHLAIIKGEVKGKNAVSTRIHSECLTGDALGSLRCDCRDQLTSSLEMIEELGSGMVLYLRQEGRGIGLVNKVKAYHLQDEGYDTVEADRMLGFSGDERKYPAAAEMIRLLGVRSVKLITNNPAKVAALQEAGITVSERIPHIMETNRFNEKYLQTKQEKAGHMLGIAV